MALVTRCPKCGTMFRVVPDQLRVSAGWVRCGHCQEVFDAAQRMLPRGSELAALEEKQAREPREAGKAREERETREREGAVTSSASLLQRREGEPQPAAATPKGGAASAAQPPLPSLPPLPSPNEPPPAPPDEQPNEPLPPAPAEKPSQSAPRRAPGAPNTAFMAELDAARAAVVIGEPAAPPPAPADVKVGSSGDAPPPASAATSQGSGGGSKPPHEPVDLFLSELGEDLDDDGEAPLFVQRARRRQPASPHMRVLLWCALAALTLTLVLQVLISERNWLAARQPALAPALRGLCSVFNCRVGPYQHIDAIVIDNSGFSRAEDGSFLFHYTLRNHAGLPVATPALELTLTDAQERALVRRVISVQELGAPASIAARGEYSGARSITLGSAANPSAVTGYKLLAFYP